MTTKSLTEDRIKRIAITWTRLKTLKVGLKMSSPCIKWFLIMKPWTINSMQGHLFFFKRLHKLSHIVMKECKWNALKTRRNTLTPYQAVLLTYEYASLSVLFMFSYLIFVTGSTGGARVNFFLPGVNFYRFNAKNWQFTV